MVIKTERAHQRLSQNLPEQPQLRALENFVLVLQDQHYQTRPCYKTTKASALDHKI